MQNLEQIRARNAIQATGDEKAPQGKNGGDVAKKVPAMIMESGLLGALAFAIDAKAGHEKVLQGAIRHYQEVDRQAPATDDLVFFAGWLGQQDSARLRAATSEILAYLNYYRRFVRPAKKEGNQNADSD